MEEQGTFLSGKTGNHVLNMMMKMGYSGQGGLGKNRDGISEAIQVKQRPKGVGLGAIDEKTDQQLRMERDIRRKRGEATSDDEEQDREFQVVSIATNSVASHAPIQARQRRKWRRTESGAVPGGDASIDIIDMRGPRQIGTTSSTEAVYDGKPSVLRELRYNINMLHGTAESGLVDVMRKLTRAQAELRNLQAEAGHTAATDAGQASNAEKLAQVVEGLAHLHTKVTKLSNEDLKPVSDKKGNLERLADNMKQLRDHSPAVFNAYDVEKVGAALAITYLERAAPLWDPGQSSDLDYDVLAWRKFLVEDHDPNARSEAHMELDIDEKRSENAKDLSNAMKTREALRKGKEGYSKLCGVVLARLEAWIKTEWQPNDAEGGLFVCDTWEKVFPDSLNRQMGRAVVQRLVRAVDAWVPAEDETIHLWLQPWLLKLKEELKVTGVYENMLHKYSQYLDMWDTTKIQKLLAPWVPIIPDLLAEFSVTQVQPNLHKKLQGMELMRIDGEDAFQQLRSVLDWREFFPINAFGDLFLNAFFPRWCHAAYLLTKAPSWTGQHVQHWYTQWKKEFGDLAERPKFLWGLCTGLDAMEKSIQDVEEGAPDLQLDHFKAILAGVEVTPQQPTARTTSLSHHLADALAARTIHAEDDVSPREVLTRLAEENDIAFVPKHGMRTHDGKPIYSFGTQRKTVSISMDTRTIYLNNTTPISADELVEMVRQK